MIKVKKIQDLRRIHAKEHESCRKKRKGKTKDSKKKYDGDDGRGRSHLEEKQ